MIEDKKGCVYFFRHIGLTPVKIGYSSSNSPISRFNSFKTYAPYGAELLGFIQTDEAKELETKLHNKYSAFRMDGEWFDISKEIVDSEIQKHTNYEDIKDRNNFEIKWAKYLEAKKDKKLFDIMTMNQTEDTNHSRFLKIYELDKNFNRTKVAEQLGVSRRCVINWINKLE